VTAAVNRILFVCTGNTCRSPMAAGIFRSLAKAHPTLRNVVVESAGIGALPDHPASAAAVEVMKGIWDISGHRSQTLGHAHLERSDLVLTMSQDHIFYVQAHHERANVRALADYVGMGKDDVPDPFGGSRKDYVRCRDHLKKLIEALVRRLDRDGTP